MNAIEITGLKKSFGDIKAVDDISFFVKRGSLFAFLGLNGDGKSTTINIICTLLKKDAGKVRVAGVDLDSDPFGVRERIGVIFQNSVLDKRLSVEDNLTIRASLYGMHGASWKSRLRGLTELMSLDEILKRPYGKLSGGQRRRADIARGLINSPQILILDEPTTGLDPQTRKTVWDVVDGLRKELGMTVFLTTHYMEEANGADEVVIIDAGKIVARGTPVELKNAYSSDVLVSYMPASAEFEAALKERGCAYFYDAEKRSYRIKLADTAAARDIMIAFPQFTRDVEILKGKMDDVFLNVTGRDINITEEADARKN